MVFVSSRVEQVSKMLATEQDEHRLDQDDPVQDFVHFLSAQS